MKKLLCFAALVLGMASCQKDVNSLEVNVGEQETVVTVSLPEVTRANSANSGWENTGNDLRVIFQVYDEFGNTTVDMRQTAELKAGETSTNFAVRLVPKHTYTFVAWADQGEDYFDVTDLENVKFATNAWTAMNEGIDAYTATQTISTDNSIPNVELTLTRPFAKVRVVATDIEAIRDLGWDPTSAVATYAETVPVSFDAVAGTVGTEVMEKPTREVEFPSVYTDTEGEMTLFADYLFVPANGTAKFELTVNHAGGEIRTVTFNTEIPAVRNNLTTIKGNILTGDSKVTVTVDKDFAAETIYLEGDVTLTEDLIIDRPLVVSAGAKAVLNLNGHDIINNTKSETFGEGEGIIVYGNLTIKGQGTVQGSTMAVWARGAGGNAVVNIEGGTYKGCAEGFAKGGRSVIYASGNNTINIYGGTFQALAADKTSYANKTEGVYAALNVADYVAKTGTYNGHINVYGGSFYKQNPAAPGTEPAAWNAIHTNGFVAEGCRVEPDGDWFDVIYDPYYYYTKVSDVTGLKNAATDKANKIYLNPGEYTLDEVVYFTSDVELVSDGPSSTKIIGKIVADENFNAKGIRFEGNDTVNTTLASKYGSYVNKTSAGALCSLITCVKNASFENCTIVSNISKSWRGINHTTSSDLYELNINSCAFEGDFYFISTRINFNIQNCTFNSTYNGNGLAAVWCYGLRDAGSSPKKGTIVFSNNKNVSTNGMVLLGVYFGTANFVFDADMTMENNIGWGEYAFDYSSKAVFGDVTLNGTTITK